MGLQDIGSIHIPDMEIIMHIEHVISYFTSFALVIAEGIMCLYGTFIVCFRIFLFC